MTALKEYRWEVLQRYMKEIDRIFYSMNEDIKIRERDNKKWMGTETLKRYVYKYEYVKKKLREERDRIMEKSYGTDKANRKLEDI